MESYCPNLKKIINNQDVEYNSHRGISQDMYKVSTFFTLKINVKIILVNDKLNLKNATE